MTTIQFLVKANQRNLQTEQVLPSVFTEVLYTGCNRLYLIHNRGTKHEVFIRKVSGTNNYALFSNEWRAFLQDSQYVRVSTFHFIRQGVNEYYVTAYQNDGFECNGDDLEIEREMQKRCLVTMADMEQSPVLPDQFVVNLDHNRVRIMVSGVLVSTVTLRKVVQPDDSQGHVFGGEGWTNLANVENLKVGTRLVFTNVLNNNVSLVPFYDSGMAMRFEYVPRMRLNQERPFIKRMDEKDGRLEHDCEWINHEQHHEDEDMCFYSPIVAYITDRNRLTIPSWFVRDYKIHKYHNALLCYESTLFYVNVDFEPHADRADNKHMKITTNWRNIISECDFKPNKMIRFKLIYDDVPDILESKNNHKVSIPLFHMC